MVRPRIEKPSLDQLDINHLLPVRQSAHRQYSTQTAVTIIYTDIVTTIGAATFPLDLSTAFDTIDHDVLIDVLQKRFDVHDNGLEWIRSYHNGHTHAFRTVSGGSGPVALTSISTGISSWSSGVCDIRRGSGRYN